MRRTKSIEQLVRENEAMAAQLDEFVTAANDITYIMGLRMVRWFAIGLVIGFGLGWLAV